jgi:hypothetical protein
MACEPEDDVRYPEVGRVYTQSEMRDMGAGVAFEVVERFGPLSVRRWVKPAEGRRLHVEVGDREYLCELVREPKDNDWGPVRILEFTGPAITNNDGL